MKKRVLITLLVAVFALVFFAGCASMDWGATPDLDSGAHAPPPVATPPPSGGGGDDAAPDYEHFDAINNTTTQTRLVVYTATFIIHSDYFEDTLMFLRSTIDRSQGEWFDREEVQFHDRHAVLVARVASTRLHYFIDDIIAEIGLYNIRHHDIMGTDVSLTHRNRELQIEEYERYLTWLHDEMERAIAQNQPFNSRAQIQTRINQAQTRLNALMTAQNTVNQQILFSTVTITLREHYPPPPVIEVPEPPPPQPTRARIFFRNVWSVISWILMAIGYSLAVIIPLALVVVPIVFLIRFLVKREKSKRKALAMAANVSFNHEPRQNSYNQEQFDFNYNNQEQFASVASNVTEQEQTQQEQNDNETDK